MTNLKLLILPGIVVSFVIYGMTYIPNPNASVLQAAKANPARFERGSSIIFEHRPHQSLTGIVYKDRETGIEYMYIWDGAANGGPCITRLWKKGE